MSLVRTRAAGGPRDATEQLARRTRDRRSGVSLSSSMKLSTLWAALRLRFELIGMLPVDVYRRVDGIDVEVPKPPVLVEPSRWAEGHPIGIDQWIASSQMDLDRFGNAVGLVTARDGTGRPAAVDLVPFEDVTVTAGGSQVVGYRLGKKHYEPMDVWHERAYVPAGSPVGLSALAAAAWSIQTGLSAAAFARAWFTGAGVPSGELVWEKGTLDGSSAEVHKRRFLASVQAGEPFVHGKDWSYRAFGAKASEAAFLEQQRASSADVCRFVGVPGDMVDVPAEGSSVTYANITQRNLQLLVINLGAPIVRREKALSRWVDPPRFVKLNTDALLRMDPKAREDLLLARVQGKVLAPSEARALDNLPPLTAEQEEEMVRLGIVVRPGDRRDDVERSA